MSSRATIDRVLRDYDNGEYFRRLVNHPSPHPLRQTPTLVYHGSLNDLEPRFTVVTPMFNHVAILEAYIEATATQASMPFDWIIVDDGSDDGTPERAKAIFTSRRLPLVARATILRNPAPVFETACDNLGFALAETEVIVEIQGDIQVREPGYDTLLLRALATEPRPSAISGRCGHTFAHMRRSPLARRFFESPAELIGLCGRAIDTPDSIDVLRGRAYRCETVNRGPWALLKTDLERHGYLDEKFFFLGDDDHDYHRRLFETEGRRPVYLPMSIYSPRPLGPSRRRRAGDNRRIFEMLKREKNGSPAFRRFLAAQKTPSLPQQIV